MTKQPFDNEWQSGYQGEGWERVKKEVAFHLQNTEVLIIILGPGDGSTGYEKRVQIRKHLEHHEKNAVAFPEDLVSDESAKILRDQLPYLKRAHVIVALIVADKRVSGVLEEVDHYPDRLRDFVDKTWLVLPRSEGGESGPKALVGLGVDLFPEEHKLYYNPQQFEDCNTIRSFINSKVDAARSEIFHQNIR